MSQTSYLLDSHILVWLDAGNPRMTAAIQEKLDRAEALYVSAATAWELSLKVAARKLAMRGSVAALLETHQLVELPVHVRHADRAASLPFHHSDPFDRMLVAQALAEGLTLVTADRKMLQYGVPILFV